MNWLQRIDLRKAPPPSHIGPFPLIVTEACPPGEVWLVPQLDPLPFESQEGYWRRLGEKAVRLTLPEEIP